MSVNIQIKICGIRTKEDALWSAEQGADMLGLLFYKRSPRNVSLDEAVHIKDALSEFYVRKNSTLPIEKPVPVAVFADTDSSFIEEVILRLNPPLLQFHGDQDDAFCSSFGRNYIKSIRSLPGDSIARQAAAYPRASALLLDTAAKETGEYGGSGQTFDWSRIPSNLEKPLLIGGGLTPENVGNLLQNHTVQGVDVSSGVESAPGIKDKEKIRRFINAVRVA